MKGLRLRPEARIEVADASVWYESDYPGRGARFRDAVDATLRRVLAAPHTFPLWGRRRDVRFSVMPGFPFTVIFRLEGEVVMVYAVAHHSRRPGYWRNRLTKG